MGADLSARCDPPGLLSGLATVAPADIELSIDAADRAVALDPEGAPAYGAKALSRLYLNRLDDAERTIRQATERKLDTPDFVMVPYFIAFLNGDAADISRRAELAREKPSLKT